MKTLLFTAALLLTFFAKAQVKYQFMVIEYSSMDNEVAISIDGKEFKKDKVDFDKHKKSGYNANPLLEKVNEYQDKDWELMNFNTQIGGPYSQTGSNNSSEIHFAYLRKKK